MLAEVFVRLRTRFPDLFLVVVPRHFERGKEAGRDLDTKGVKYIYRNQINSNIERKPGEVECLLVNTTGELRLFYEHATVIFVGKSFIQPGGGQNPIEPGSMGKAMVFGPNMQNFSSIVSAFVAKEGAVQVRDKTELEAALAELLNNQSRREALGRNALKVVEGNQGAIERTVEMIVEHLRDEEMFIRK